MEFCNQSSHPEIGIIQPVPLCPPFLVFVFMKNQNLAQAIHVFSTLTSSRIIICYNFDLEVLVLVPTLTVKGAAGWKTTPRLSTETGTPDLMKYVGFSESLTYTESVSIGNVKSDYTKHRECNILSPTSQLLGPERER